MQIPELEFLLMTYWWVILIIIALIFSVRGTIPIWLGLAFSAIMLLSFSNNTISYGLRAVISSGTQALMNAFR